VPRGPGRSGDLLFVGDGLRHRIIVLDTSLHFEFAFGREGREAGQLMWPRGLAANDKELFVADSYNRRIQVFTLTGVFLRQWGHEGEDIGQFGTPFGVALGHGFLFVSDFGDDDQTPNKGHGYLHVFTEEGVGVQRMKMPGRLWGACAGKDHSHALYAVDYQHQEIHRMVMRNVSGADEESNEKLEAASKAKASRDAETAESQTGTFQEWRDQQENADSGDEEDEWFDDTEEVGEVVDEKEL